MTAPPSHSPTTTKQHIFHLPTSLSNEYTLHEHLGSGAFAKVYLIHHKSTSLPYALKIIPKSQLAPSDKTRISREISILSKTSHINIIKFHRLLETQSHYYIITDYCKNGELFQYILTHRNINESEASIFFYQIVNAVHYLHSLNIIHRDIKPENILLSENNILKVIDFGLSNYYSKNKLLETPCGSLCYAAPETLTGCAYDGKKSDVWSIGVILFAMLCGYLPFQNGNDSNQELYMRVMLCQYEVPHYVCDEAKELICKILVRDPYKRVNLNEIVESKFYIRGKRGFNKRYGMNNNNNNNSCVKNGHRSSLLPVTGKEDKKRLVSAFVPRSNYINERKYIHVKKRNVISNDVVVVCNTQVQSVSLSCSPKKCKGNKNCTIKRTSLKLNVNHNNKNKSSVSRNKQYKSITQRHSRQISFDIKKQSNELSFNKTKCSLNTSNSPTKHKNTSTCKYKYNTHTKHILKTIIANYTDRNTPIKYNNNHNINSTLNATCSTFNRRHRTSLLYNSSNTKPKCEIKTKLKEKVFKLVNQQQ